jgi:hypothetical protein
MKPTPPRMFFGSDRMYKGFTLEDVATRPGCLDILRKPSLMPSWSKKDAIEVLHRMPAKTK